jgi:hypothetical protein
MAFGMGNPQVRAALAFAVFAAAALVMALEYPMGTLTRMGAGFFPAMICVALIGLSAAAALEGRKASAETIDLRIRPFILIMGGIAAWALLVEPLGFIAASMLLIACVAAAELENTVQRGVVLALGLTVAGYLLFVQGLGIPLTAFGR